ncbi:MAG: hypothetical protein KA385_03200, partial [Vicinamibacteria bacterium]|nr:hypothetical protein [Vicinamibacteria bacterium]
MKKLLLFALAGSSLIGAARPAPFDLSVASIMRGPKLVGYAPDSIRWAGDSKEFWFEWRQSGDAETSTWVANAATGVTRKLTDAERKAVPAPGADWDKARRRAVFAQGGDVVLVDTVARTRRVITRTSGAEARPRFVKNETHVAFLSSGALFLIPIEGDGEGALVQVYEAGPRKKDPPLTDSQKTVRDE